MKSFAFLLIAVFLVSCQSSDHESAECSKMFQAPKVQELGVEALYKEACWQLYKFNLLQTDSFVLGNPIYLDSVFHETALSEFNLVLNDVKQVGDSITFFLPFEKGIVPLEKPYFYAASFWKNTQKVTIGDDLIITWNRDTDNDVFEAYLKNHANRLSPMLHCLAMERGVLSRTAGHFVSSNTLATH